MAEEHDPGDRSHTVLFKSVWITVVLWAVVILSILLIPLIFVLPASLFWLVGNTLEVAVAGFCMVCCLFLYRTMESRVIYSLAAFAFFGYALSNLFWYLYSVTFGRSDVYTTVAELGFFCIYLFFISAIRIEFPERPVPAFLTGTLLLFLVGIPVLVTAAACMNHPLRIVLATVTLILIEQLIEVTIRHGVFRFPLLCTGIILMCTADILYVIRETLVLYNVTVFLPSPIPGETISLYYFLSIVGPLMICSFALIVLGLQTFQHQEQDADFKGNAAI